MRFKRTSLKGTLEYQLNDASLFAPFKRYIFWYVVVLKEADFISLP